MNKKEQRRLLVLNQMEEGEIIGREAAETLALSLCHVMSHASAVRLTIHRLVID